MRGWRRRRQPGCSTCRWRACCPVTVGSPRRPIGGSGPPSPGGLRWDGRCGAWHAGWTMAELQPAVMARIRRHVASHAQFPDAATLGALVREGGGVLGQEDLAALPGRVRAELLGAGPLQRLPDGTRLHAVLPPVAAGGALISLRVLRRQPFRLAELVAGGSIAPAVALVLQGLVDGRANLLVSGATGTGKTTLLATLLSAVDPAERIVCIEEARELVADHPHVVHLVARRPNVEGAGEVGLAALVRHALRMRPDRIVLGECRGAEVREVLTALNTGHQGGCATVHANALVDLPARLAALGALAGMTPAAVAAQAVSALDAVVHLRRDGGRRYVAQVGAVLREPGDGWRVD